MTARDVVVATILLVPAPAWACASCLASGYGDRTYNVAYLGLLLMPFVLLVSIGGILAWAAGIRPRALARALRGHPARGTRDGLANEETT